MTHLVAAVLACVVGTPEAQVAAFWLQHYARPALSPAELDPPLLALVIFVPPG